MSHLRICNPSTLGGEAAIADTVLAVARHLVSVHMEAYAQEVLTWYLAGGHGTLYARVIPDEGWIAAWERVP